MIRLPRYYTECSPQRGKWWQGKMHVTFKYSNTSCMIIVRSQSTRLKGTTTLCEVAWVFVENANKHKTSRKSVWVVLENSFFIRPYQGAHCFCYRVHRIIILFSRCILNSVFVTRVTRKNVLWEKIIITNFGLKRKSLFLAIFRYFLKLIFWL